MVREARRQPALSLLYNRQCRYRYRQLTVPRSQPTRDIFSVTILEGERLAPPGELAKENNDWFKFIDRGRETLGQQLAGMIAEGTTNDAIACIEYTEWVQPETFPRRIAPLAGDNKEEARETTKHTHVPGEVLLWTGGSRLDSRYTGASVALSHPE